MDGAAFFFQVKRKQLRPATVQGYEKSLTQMVHHLGADYSLTCLVQPEVERYVMARLAEGGGPVSIRRDLAFMSSLLSVCRAKDGDIPEDPGIRAFLRRPTTKAILPDAKKKTRWLTPDEMRALWFAAKRDYQRLIVVLGCYTGMRLGEMIQMRWSEVDFQRRRIVLEQRTKTGQQRIIPMSDLLFGTLTDTFLARSSNEWVFWNARTEAPMKWIYVGWRRMCLDAKLPGVTPHTLRHTFASWGLQSGVAEKTLMDITGHQTRSMLARYAHSSESSLRDGINQIAAVTFLDTPPVD